MSPDDAETVTAHISLNGPDRTGVVARVTQFLFREGANIEALEELVTRGEFHMSLTATWPAPELADGDMARMKDALAEIGREVEMETRVRFHEPHKRQRLCIMVTKEPHCFETILQAHEADELGLDPVLVVGNRDDLRSVAEAVDLPFVQVSWADPRKAEEQLLALLDEYDIDVIALARFMRILSPELCWRYRNKIINVHPSLLPAFPGARAYAQAYERGVRIVGATAHFVTPDLDQGPIITQDAFRVDPDEELDEIKAQGQRIEAKVLLEALQLYVDKRLDVHWGRVWSA